MVYERILKVPCLHRGLQRVKSCLITSRGDQFECAKSCPHGWKDN